MLEDPVETRLYLAAPPLAIVDIAMLKKVLGHGVACLGVDISGFTDDQAEALESIIGAADSAGCAVVIGGDDTASLDLAGRFAVDGVQIEGTASRVAYARKRLGKDAIIGYGAGLSRPDALLAAEGGADYVMLSPVTEVEPDLAVWWQAVIETPLVVGGITAPDHIDSMKGVADFVLLEPDYTRPAAQDLIEAAIARLG